MLYYAMFFAAAATFKTISLPVRLYAEMNRVKWIVLTANEQKCVCYYHRGICSHHNCTGGLVSSFGTGFCDLTHRCAVFLSEKLFQQLDFSVISPIASSAASLVLLLPRHFVFSPSFIRLNLLFAPSLSPPVDAHTRSKAAFCCQSWHFIPFYWMI